MGRTAITSGGPVRTRRQRLLWSPLAIVPAIVVGGIWFLAFAGSPLPS